MRVADENSTWSSIAIEPRDGVRRPAMASSVVVFPAPDGPKSAVIRPVSCWLTSRTNSPCSMTKSSAITIERSTGS